MIRGDVHLDPAVPDRPELVVFDLAGTTVADHGQVPESFAQALAEQGIRLTPAQLVTVRGASKRESLRRFLPPGPALDEQVQEAYAAFRARLERRYATEGVWAVPGAERAFQVLRQAGMRVVLTTGFDHGLADLLLGTLGWNHGQVDAVFCGDDVPQGRPAPYLIFRAMEAVGAWDVHRVASIGDTTRDLLAAHHAGVGWNIGVLTGAHDRHALEGAPHTHLLGSVAEVPGLWGLG